MISYLISLSLFTLKTSNKNKKIFFLIKKNIFFLLHLFFHAITAPYTLKISRNNQGFALIQAVLFFFVFHAKSGTTNNHRKGSSDIAYQRFFSRYSNDVKFVSYISR